MHEAGINDLIYRPPIDQQWQDAWDVSEAEIEIAERSARRHDAMFLTVIVGTGMQVLPNPAAQARYLRTVGGTDLLYPNHRLAALGARDGFSVLDLASPMKAYAQANGVYFHGFSRPGTGHWNRRGNCFAGVLVANRLAAMIAQSGGVAGNGGGFAPEPLDAASACLGGSIRKESSQDLRREIGEARSLTCRTNDSP